MSDDSKFTLKIPSQTKYLEQVEEFVASIWQKASAQKEIDHNIEFLIKLAVHEACLNSIRHAYKEDPNKEITVECEINSGDIKFFVIEHGESFDFDSLVYDDSNPGESGYGVHIIRSVMDEVVYCPHAEEGNVLKMVKNI